MADRYDDRYRGESYREERAYGRDRGPVARASDEIRSWFGDDEAERRRRLDEQERARRERMYRYGRDPRGTRRDFASDYDYGPASERDWRDDRSEHPERWATDYGRAEYDRTGPRTAYGDGYGSRDWAPSEGGQRGREPRHAGESRGYYETRGRVHEFSHGYAGRGPKGYVRSDERIREDVCDRLADDWDVDASDIEIAVNKGDVTLSGTVRTRDEKRRSEDLVENISGVREVHNNLRVNRAAD